jgi:adenylate kinase
MIAVLLGPPGSGKGTQAELLAPALGIPHVSTGECLRAEVAAATELGREVEPLLAAGHLVPDELIERVLERRLAAPDAARGALLDGFPRTVEQARALDRMLVASGRRVAFVVVLHVAEAVLTERLLRRAGEQHRSDDNPGSIAERLAEYRQMTEPVVNHYRRERAPICDVDGEADVETVHRRIVRAVTSLAAGAGRPSEK